MHPYGPDCGNDERINHDREMMREVIKEYDEKFDFHDFRVVDGKQRTNFIFDLVIPHNYPKSKQQIIKDLQAQIIKKDKRAFLVITVEHSFT